MIRISSVLFIISFCVHISFSDYTSGKTLITGDAMEIKNAGNIMISKGHSIAVNKNSIISADEMSYEKEIFLFVAKGNIKLSFKIKKNELLEIFGKISNYNLDTQKGRIWGGILIKYFVNNSTSPLTLCAKDAYIDQNAQVLKVFNDVVVTTSSGTIYADNGVFDKKALGIVFKKDKKKPIAHVLGSGNKGVYEADEMIFFNSQNQEKKIIMRGSVVGKIKIEDKKNDIKN